MTINTSERGLLLLRIRDEIRMTVAAYQTLYESSVAFGMRKALQAEQGKLDMEAQVCFSRHVPEELMWHRVCRLQSLKQTSKPWRTRCQDSRSSAVRYTRFEISADNVLRGD